MKDRLILLLAQGFGTGFSPIAPGTFGTLPGFIWLATLLVPGNLLCFVLGSIFGVLASCWLCTEAERILKAHDPGSVVLDEIIAIPICFLPWLAIQSHRGHPFPNVEEMFTAHWKLCLIAFCAFRFFDILKPYPVFQLQKLPGGIGVTLDDVMAGIYAGTIVAATLWL